MTELKSLHDLFNSSTSPCWRSFLPKRAKIDHVHKLTRGWKLSKKAKEKAIRVGRFKRQMEMKNLKLYLENKIIVDENEKLRKKAMVLLRENKILLSQLQDLPQPSGSPGSKI